MRIKQENNTIIIVVVISLPPPKGLHIQGAQGMWLFSSEIGFSCLKFGFAGIGVRFGEVRDSREGKAEIRTRCMNRNSLLSLMFLLLTLTNTPATSLTHKHTHTYLYIFIMDKVHQWSECSEDCLLEKLKLFWITLLY